MDYYLIPNRLTNDGSYMARVVNGRVYNKHDLIDRMLRERNLVSRPDVEGVLAAEEEAIAQMVSEGHLLNLPLMRLGYSLRGSFASIKTKRDPNEHPLEINLQAGSLLTDALAAVDLKRIHAPNFDSRITRFVDYESQTSNTRLTPGGMFEIIGERLRIGGDQPERIGLYLRGRDLKETQVTSILKNEPTLISGQIPAGLAPGSYQVVIRTQVGTSGNRFLKEVRTSISDVYLEVE